MFIEICLATQTLNRMGGDDNGCGKLGGSCHVTLYDSERAFWAAIA